jgi:arylsulfatase A-like enzyme
MKALVFVFDGLRPDHITPALMPHLARFAAEGVRFANARTIFPSETRVAVSSLVTGCRPGSHGVAANQFVDRKIFADRPVDTGSRADLEALQAAQNGVLLMRPSLSERLHGAGLRHAVVSSASPGSSYLLDANAKALGQFSWSVHGAGNTPDDLAAEILERYGPVPAAAIPTTARVAYAATVLLDFVLPRLAPDVAFFWSSDPDTTYHYRGLGGDDTRAALRGADEAFGRVADWWRTQGLRAGTQLIVASDHGHVTGESKIDLVAAMQAAGLPAGTAMDSDAVVLPGTSTMVYVRRNGVVDRIADWLRDQPWCGLVFVRANWRSDALDLREIGVDHPRAGELVFTFAGSDDPDRHGNPGRYPFDGELPVGAGTHGGLHRRELSNVLIAGGDAFRAGVVSELPAGLIDVAPTIAHLLGLPGDGFDGRVLREAFADSPPSEAHALAPATTATRRLDRWQVGRHIYLAGDATPYA